MSWLNCFYTITGKVIIINKSFIFIYFIYVDKERVKMGFSIRDKFKVKEFFVTIL